MGSKETKAGRADDAIFRLYSLGLATNRDAYIYNFSRDACAENAERNDARLSRRDFRDEENPELTVDEVGIAVTRRILKWDSQLERQS